MPEELESAIELIHQGKKADAGRILMSLVKSEPYNESAWIWLSTCVGPVEQKRQCLNQALRINPSNQDAKQKLSDLNMPALASVVENKSPDNGQEQYERRELQPVSISIHKDESDSLQSDERIDKNLLLQEVQNIRDIVHNLQRTASASNVSNSINLFFASISAGNIFAAWWALSYIQQTVIGELKLPLVDYLNGKEYGMALGAVELLFVVVSRYLIGFGLSSGLLYFVLKGLTSIFGMLSRPAK